MTDIFNPEVTQSRIELESLVETLRSSRFTFVTELQLQDGIEQVLQIKQIPYDREFVASAKDRFDFLLPGGAVIEVKTKWSWSDCLRQLGRYAEREDVEEIVIVGTPRWINRIPSAIHGKRIHRVHLIGSLL